jgi:nitroimidazol reductase NimA-like FMN-containing flavoprotein (pyridoxamine 5'-phosphate oxidase superfamily)
MITELGKMEARELLRQQKTGRLGCCVNGDPYVVPINYLYDGDCIYIHALPGRKIRALRNNPRACLQADEVTDEYNWRSVIAFGKYEEITEAAERERILSALYKHLPHLTPVESRMTQGIPEVVVFRLRIEEITGVSEYWRP